jgi:hypothetical protein
LFVTEEKKITSPFCVAGSLIIADIEPEIFHEAPIVLYWSPRQKDVSKNVGKKMSEDGFVPNFPVLLIPGFASSGEDDMTSLSSLSPISYLLNCRALCGGRTSQLEESTHLVVVGKSGQPKAPHNVLF